MAETKREIERKYEATDRTELPDLTRAAGVASVEDRGVDELDAVYYDTPDLRLAADSLTLRRRTGGGDAGWHLKFPVASGIRDEIRAPLSDTLPRVLAGLLRSRVRDGEVLPVVRLRSSRAVHHLRAEDGALLAELSVDTVHAERLGPGEGATADWTEIEVELADGADQKVLDAVEKRLKRAGVRPSEAPSKLARALEETAGKDRAGKAAAKAARRSGEAQARDDVHDPDGKRVAKHARRAGGGAAGEADLDSGTAGAAVLAYVRRQRDALVALDPAVRRDLPDSVHQMRVACRRLRSALKTYRKVLDRTATDPVRDELKWLAGELGHARDQEVLVARLRGHLDDTPRPLLLGPLRNRLRIWDAARSGDARRRSLAALDSPRHLALLDALDALLTDPPLRKRAGRPAADVLPKAVLKAHGRLSAAVDHALGLDPGHDRDLALHEARKAAKRARYAAEVATPTLGKPAKKLASRVKAVQSLLGEHQDSVVAREALRALAVQAHGAGENAFTWGLLYGREEAAAARTERELPEAWAAAETADL
ncbi:MULTISPECIES: CYTH and CHAD domain-containing protein [Streptomyces]|uniref:CYTH and CHAD domain-containing protein n=1 Tax=Streptomyces solicathayae TaxID=3081768 RepID=A0ABZ0LY58_9ACTN|nr:CYTH and CHAD domain-containing protein [Streptomyces sp. HUAS YS2]WOX24387.1 CYTH and CHAD domain-containing protein [Streptomyces sp. HUAS YS2]